MVKEAQGTQVDDDSDLDVLVKDQGAAEIYPLRKIARTAKDEDDNDDNDYGHLSPWSSDDEGSFKEETEGFQKHVRFENGRRRTDSTVQSYMLYTPEEERRVIKKFDRRLVLFMAFLYMLSFLDRSSKIGWHVDIGMKVDNVYRYWKCSYTLSQAKPEPFLIRMYVNGLQYHRQESQGLR